MRKRICIICMISLWISVNISLQVLAATLTVGDKKEYKSITDAVAAASDGDEIIISGGIYDESRETFPIEVGKTVYIHAAPGEDVLLRSPLTKLTMKLKTDGIRVENLGFEFIRSGGMHILGDHVELHGCRFTLGDPQWRETSCGLWIAGSKYVSVIDTEFIDSSIAIAGSPDTGVNKEVPVLTALFEVGEDIEYFTTHTFQNNTVNGKPMEYVIGLHDQEYTSDCGQLIAVNCENVVFTGLDVSQASIGFQLVCSNHCTIRDSNMQNSGIFGLYLAKCEDCFVENIVADNGSHGIDIRDCDSCVVEKCSANQSGQGIFLSWARECGIKNCEVCSCGTGIFSASGDRNYVDSCTVNDNELGLYIKNETFTMTDSTLCNNDPCGLRMTDCVSDIRDNTFRDNFEGSVILNSDTSFFANNHFEGSIDYDLYFKNCTGMEYADNTFSKGLEETVFFQ